ncbi:MAG: DegV family protein [Clostridia bacterium]|nr:DegV family protein [Clostridia bacterium]
MRDYVIFTDSACDIKPELLAEWGVPYRCLTFRFDGEEKEYSNDDMPVAEFYNKMREGGVAKTAAVNAEAFAELFEEEALKKGKDVLYVGFSSGLSTTYNSARIASLELKEKYPEAKIVVVDTLAASAGEGLMLYLTVEQKKNGATIEEAEAFVRDLIGRMGIWFTVDDLVYLKRGGRVSPTAAFVGNLLGIKPVLYMDNEGHLIPVSKVRGRRTSIVAMADKYTEKAVDKENGTVFISHGDCLADAQLLADMLKERHGVKVKIITDVGPVIGAHSGPGTIALFFVADAR